MPFTPSPRVPEHFGILRYPLIITNYGTQSPRPQIEYQGQLCDVTKFCLADVGQ